MMCRSDGFSRLKPEERFVRGFWLTYDFQPFPQRFCD
jgi:hypothetical protein